MFKSKRKHLNEIWNGEYYQDIGNIVRFAPSACNTQPWKVTAEEKGCLSVSLRQPVQQPPGESPGGAVIKGQGNVFGIAHRPCRDRQQTQAKKNHQYFSHDFTSLVSVFI